MSAVRYTFSVGLHVQLNLKLYYDLAKTRATRLRNNLILLLSQLLPVYPVTQTQV